MLEGILNLPIAPGVEREEDVGADNRYKLVLLHRERDTYTALAIPYGADLRAKVEVPSAVYLKASPLNVKYRTLEDPTISLVKHKNYIYPTITFNDKRQIIPYKTKQEFPEAYTDNRFYTYLQEQIDDIFKIIDRVFSVSGIKDISLTGLMNNVLTMVKREVDIDEIKKDAEMLSKLQTDFNLRAYSLIEELFSAEQNPSSRMTRLERKSKHFFDKNLEIQNPDIKKGKGIKGFLYSNIKRGLLQPFAPTFEKRNYLVRNSLKNESSRKRTKEMLSAISEMYPAAFYTLKEINDNLDLSASKTFRNLAILGGLGAMPFNFYAGLGIISYGLLDRFFAKRHSRNEGVHTGLIGQVRDLFVKEELRDFYVFDVLKKGYLI